eukprot:g1407.t1
MELKVLHDLYEKGSHTLPGGKQAVARRMLIRQYFREPFMPELHFACALGDPEWIKLALSNITAGDAKYHGNEAAAAGSGPTHRVDEGAPGTKLMGVMLALGGVYLDAKQLEGTTPLMLAAGVGGLRAVDALLGLGARPSLDATNAVGMRALDYACAAPDGQETAERLARAEREMSIGRGTVAEERAAELSLSHDSFTDPCHGRGGAAKEKARDYHAAVSADDDWTTPESVAVFGFVAVLAIVYTLLQCGGGGGAQGGGPGGATRKGLGMPSRSE